MMLAPTLARTGYSGGCVYDPQRDEWKTAAIFQLNRESRCARCKRDLALNAFVTRTRVAGEQGYVCDSCRPWHVRPGYWNRTGDYIGPLPWLNCPMCMSVRQGEPPAHPPPEDTEMAGPFRLAQLPPGATYFAAAIKGFDDSFARADTLMRSAQQDGLSAERWDEYCLAALVDFARAEAFGELLRGLDPGGAWVADLSDIQQRMARLRNVLLSYLAYRTHER